MNVLNLWNVFVLINEIQNLFILSYKCIGALLALFLKPALDLSERCFGENFFRHQSLMLHIPHFNHNLLIFKNLLNHSGVLET